MIWQMLHEVGENANVWREDDYISWEINRQNEFVGK